MPIAEIDLREVSDWESFHDVFARALGFPDFYGRNMHAWVDCLMYGDDSMTAFEFSPADPLTLQLVGCNPFANAAPTCLKLWSTMPRSSIGGGSRWGLTAVDDVLPLTPHDGVAMTTWLPEIEVHDNGAGFAVLGLTPCVRPARTIQSARDSVVLVAAVASATAARS